MKGDATAGMAAADAEHLAGKEAQAAVPAHWLDVEQLALHLLENEVGGVAQQLDGELEIP